MKKFKGAVIVLVLVLVGVFIYGVSRSIVKSSYSSEKFVVEKEQEILNEKQSVTLLEEKEVEEVEVSEKVFDEETVDEEKGIAKVKELYDTEGVDERQKEFLGDRYSDYQIVLSELQGMYKDIFATKVKAIDKDAEVVNIGQFDLVFNPTLTLEDINNTDFTVIKDSLTIIGLYDNTYVLYAYNFEDTSNKLLIFADYSDSSFSTDSLSSWDFGKINNLSLSPSCIYSEVVDGYTVIFTKG